jgi:uncharacterized membrane protein
MWHQLFQNTFCNADLIGGILFLGMGAYVVKFPPASTRAIFGYRTVLSTRNADTWREANLFAARFSLKIGMVLVPLGLLMGLFFKTAHQGFYMFTVGTVAVSALMLLGNTEWHLTQTFDDQGIRKPFLK